MFDRCPTSCCRICSPGGGYGRWWRAPAPPPPRPRGSPAQCSARSGDNMEVTLYNSVATLNVVVTLYNYVAYNWGHFVQFCSYTECTNPKLHNGGHLVEGGQPVLALDQLLAGALVWQLELAAHHLKLQTHNIINNMQKFKTSKKVRKLHINIKTWLKAEMKSSIIDPSFFENSNFVRIWPLQWIDT